MSYATQEFLTCGSGGCILKQVGCYFRRRSVPEKKRSSERKWIVELRRTKSSIRINLTMMQSQFAKL